MSTDFLGAVDNRVENLVGELQSGALPYGMRVLLKGYIDYASDVILERAIPAIDGFKPSQRKILYTMYLNKHTSLTKSANVSGEVMKLHPHGDASIYDTLVHLTGKAQYASVPFIDGKGNFGKVYYSEPPAASRYTECKLSKESKLLFGEMDGVDMVASYDNKLKEPLFLPVAFPSILVNATQGIAVGMASNIPGFNLVEVNMAVIDLIEKGDFDYLLAPDFSTGGEYVLDEVELQKIMDTGRGKIKLRGTWTVDGRSIILNQIPYYTNLERIQSVIKQYGGVSDVRDESDFNGLRMVIDCKSKARVDEVLVALIRDTTLQMTVTANISVIIDNEPVTLGIKQLLKEWIKFRRGVLSKQYSVDLARVRKEIGRYDFLIQLLDDRVAFEGYITSIKASEEDGRNYLRDFANGISAEVEDGVLDWVLGLSFRSISNLSAKKAHLEKLREQESVLVSDLADIDGVICRQLREINKTYGYKRRTVISETDYHYEKEKDVKPKAFKVTVAVDGKFIKRCAVGTVEGIDCMSDDNILFIDTLGRVLRVSVDELQTVQANGMGTYIPKLLGIADDFEVVDYNIESDLKVRYLYCDGYVSVFHYGVWKDNRRKLRVLQNGISVYSNLIMGYLPDTPYVAVYTQQGKLGFAPTQFKEKQATARTKLFPVDENDVITHFVGVTESDMARIVTNYEDYIGKTKRIRRTDTFDTEYFNRLLGLVGGTAEGDVDGANIVADTSDVDGGTDVDATVVDLGDGVDTVEA